MPAKYSAPVLIVIALFVWPAKYVVIAGSRPKDVMPGSYATGIMNVTHTPVSSKRWMKSDVEMRVSNSIDEERARPQIVQGLQAIYRDRFDGLFVDKPAEKSLYSGFFSIVPSNSKIYKNILKIIHPSLAEHFKDELVGVLVAGTKVESDNKRIAKDLLRIEVAMWNKEKKTPEEVFKLLQLDKTEGNLFENPLFSTWATLFKKNGRLMYTKMSESLQEIYKGDDDKLTVLLVAGTKIEGTSVAVTKNNFETVSAKKLLDLQANQWKKDLKSATEVFKLLELDLTQGNFFENPLYFNWDNYVSRYPYPLHAKLRTLRSIYGDEVVVKLLLAGTKIASTRLIAITTLEIQVKKWKIEGTKTSEDVFKLLELDQTQGHLFENPLLPSYVDYVRSRPSDIWHTKMLVTLQLFYNNKKLASELVAGTKVDSDLDQIAKDLLSIQVKKWKEEGTKTSEEVFKLLELDQTDENILENILFPTWTILFKSGSHLSYVKTFAALQRLYEDYVLARVLVAGTKVESTSFIATKLRVVQVNQLKRGEKDAMDKFKRLKLDQTQGNLFEKPEFSLWVRHDKLQYPYTWRMNVFATLQAFKKGDDVLASVLVAGTKVESTKLVAEQLLDVLINNWKEGGKDATEVFMLLELNLIQGNLFENPLFSKWVDFVELRYPNDAYTIMSATLQAAIEGNDKLAGVLLAGMSNKRRRISVPELMRTMPGKKEALMQAVMQHLGLER